jgi:hypothetical protein
MLDQHNKTVSFFRSLSEDLQGLLSFCMQFFCNSDLIFWFFMLLRVRCRGSTALHQLLQLLLIHRHQKWHYAASFSLQGTLIGWVFHVMAIFGTNDLSFIWHEWGRLTHSCVSMPIPMASTRIMDISRREIWFWFPMMLSMAFATSFQIQICIMLDLHLWNPIMNSNYYL